MKVVLKEEKSLGTYFYLTSQPRTHLQYSFTQLQAPWRPF